mmetsp:Transcript_50980/g.69436  ORF Transcript_50980/g.69436 Transcript_50980/m.69436 type:complete len:110 (-) Transcript_50980:362-691(-)
MYFHVRSSLLLLRFARFALFFALLLTSFRHLALLKSHMCQWHHFLPTLHLSEFASRDQFIEMVDKNLRMKPHVQIRAVVSCRWIHVIVKLCHMRNVCPKVLREFQVPVL